MPHNELQNSPLGKTAPYRDKYDKSLLFPIARSKQRYIEVDKLPFKGWDIWNAYEISWLNKKGKPQIALAEFTLPYDSPNLIESKSLKLYLNSLNNENFFSENEVTNIIQQDLSQAAGKQVKVELYTESKYPFVSCFPKAINLDSIDIQTNSYIPDKNILTTDPTMIIKESLCSNLLKSNCPVTGQPDWASILIQYKGKQINHAALLKYIISFRNYQEFHEQCVEKIFLDITEKCAPEILTVYARYTRRGGLDINPIRTNDPNYKLNNHFRMIRQ